MPVAYESDGGGVFCAADNNNAVTVPLPATRPVGSVLLLAAYCRLISATVGTAPSGYTLLNTWTSGTATGGRMWLYGRIVDGSETAPSFAVSNAVTGTSGDIWAAGIVCYSGVDTSGGITSILDGTPTVQDASGTTTCTYPALTIAQANSMVMRMLCRFRDAADTFTPTATWNERADLGSTTRLGGQFHMQDKLATASGAQASVTVAPSKTSGSRYLAVTLALKAAPAATQFGAATLALAYGQTIAGVRKTFSSLALPVAFSAFVTGDKVAATQFGVLAAPWSFGASSAGQRKTFSSSAASFTFGETTQGRRKTFGVLARPFTFAAAVTGGRKTFGLVSLPISLGLVTSGIKVGGGPQTLYGIVARPFTFAAVVQGRRKTFSTLAVPLTVPSSSRPGVRRSACLAAAEPRDRDGGQDPGAAGAGRLQPGRCDVAGGAGSRRRLRGLDEGLAVALAILRPALNYLPVDDRLSGPGSRGGRAA